MSAEDRSTTSGSYKCPLCFKQYSIRSTYIRHSRQCLERTLSSPRQKSCRQCSIAKTRCDRKHPRCSRCASRDVACEYVTEISKAQRQESDLRPWEDARISHNSSSSSNDATTGTSIHDPWINNLPSVDFTTSVNASLPIVQDPVEATGVVQSSSYIPDRQEEPSQAKQSSSLDAVDLATPASSSNDLETIRDRWLYPFLSEDLSPEAHTIMTHSLNYVCRVFRTWPRMMARREQLPPFIHRSQISSERTPSPLANCFSICRMWLGHTADGGGGEIIKETIKQEMEKLFSEYRTYNLESLVAAFQVLALYAIMRLFPEPQKPSSGLFDLHTLSSLQEVCYFIGDRAFILPAEKAHTRPSWEEWVMVSCIRRTNMVLYIFEWMYATLNDLPTFPCTEISAMPAPAGKVLWSASSRQEWEDAYDRWLGRWVGLDGPFKLRQLSEVVPGTELDLRTEMWLEEADEFGIMYMALVNATGETPCNKLNS